MHFIRWCNVFRSDNKRSKREMNYAEGSHPQILQKNHLFNERGKLSSGITKKGKRNSDGI